MNALKSVISRIINTLAVVGLVSVHTVTMAQTTVVTASKLIDVEQGQVIANPVVVIENGRFIAVGQRDTLTLPAQVDETIELDG